MIRSPSRHREKRFETQEKKVDPFAFLRLGGEGGGRNSVITHLLAAPQHGKDNCRGMAPNQNRAAVAGV